MPGSVFMFAAGTALTAVGQYQSAQNQAKKSKYNAEVARNNAIAARQQAAYDAARQREKDRIAHGGWLNRKLNSGFMMGADTEEDSGSLMDLAVDDVTDREMNASLILYEGALKQNTYLSRAGGDILSGDASRQAGSLGVTKSLLSDGQTIASGLNSLIVPDDDAKNSDLDVLDATNNFTDKPKIAGI